MFLGQTVGRGRDPCPLPGSRQARGQGSVVVPTPGWPGRAPADRSPQGGEAAGGGRLLGLYVSRWASGRPDLGILFAQFPFSGLWNSAPAALPLWCPESVGPSREVGGGCRALGVCRPRSRSGWGLAISGWWCWCGMPGPGGASDPAAPPGLGDGRFPRWRRRGWSRPPRRPGRRGPGLGERVCTALPPAPAADVALGLVPCVQRPWGPLPKPARPGRVCAGPPDSAAGPARGRPRQRPKQRGWSPEPRAPSPGPRALCPSPRALCPRCPALRSRD